MPLCANKTICNVSAKASAVRLGEISGEGTRASKIGGAREGQYEEISLDRAAEVAAKFPAYILSLAASKKASMRVSTDEVREQLTGRAVSVIHVQHFFQEYSRCNENRLYKAYICFCFFNICIINICFCQWPQ